MKQICTVLVFLCVALGASCVAPESESDGLASKSADAVESKLPEATWQKLPRWRGFNLQGLFMKEDWCEGQFTETDFQYISEWGFNFVRLPMDYRFWIKDGDWRVFDEETLAKIDKAVEWGKKYDLHVMINFHRAPGYTIASPREPRNLWTDKEAQEVCALHWRTFAKRYKGIPSRELSFNLFNEPFGADATNHAEVVKLIVDAIREEDPERLIVCDELNGGRSSLAELLPLKVALSARGYGPQPLTHYKAAWVTGSDRLPVPVWPIPVPVNAFLCAHDDPVAGKKKGALEIQCQLDRETEMNVVVHEVSVKALLRVKADGTNVFEKQFKSARGQAEKYSYRRKMFNVVCKVKLPAGTKNIQIENADGDWMTISQITLTPSPGATDDVVVLGPLMLAWGYGQSAFVLGEKGRLIPANGPANLCDKDVLWSSYVEPFSNYGAQGFGLMIGEWGAYNKTPHDVLMRWSEDCLQNWQKADLGWALWELRGGFGVLDSEREDVTYEDFHGHKLDREFLELLQKY